MALTKAKEILVSVSRALMIRPSRVGDGAALAGGLLCLLSIFPPWVIRTGPIHYPYTVGIGGHWILGPWRLLDLIQVSEFTAVLLLFLVGAIVSIVHRFGVIPQVIGLVGFIAAATSRFGTLDVWPDLDSYFYGSGYALGPGVLIAMLGTLISVFAARNFWWQHRSRSTVPVTSRFSALLPSSARPQR
ncbi:MAG: hypothetical protein QXJ32_03850 [Thermoplasmata archaeon]